MAASLGFGSYRPAQIITHVTVQDIAASKPTLYTLVTCRLAGYLSFISAGPFILCDFYLFDLCAALTFVYGAILLTGLRTFIWGYGQRDYSNAKGGE